MDLPEALRQQKEQFLENAPKEVTTILGEALEDLSKSGILSNCLKKGDRAPDFILKDTSGNSISLSDCFSAGPVVLKFFRGDW